MSKKAVLGAVGSAVLGAAAGASAVGKHMDKERMRQKELADKHLALFVMMCDWMRQNQEGKSLGGYLKEAGYKSVAVYGLSYAGERVLDELFNNGLEVPYAIDQNRDSTYFAVEVCRPEEELREVDAVIVTAITFYDEIRELLENKLNCPILSLEDIIQEM